MKFNLLLIIILVFCVLMNLAESRRRRRMKTKDQTLRFACLNHELRSDCPKGKFPYYKENSMGVGVCICVKDRVLPKKRRRYFK